jgi:hypothetical protein
MLTEKQCEAIKWLIFNHRDALSDEPKFANAQFLREGQLIQAYEAAVYIEELYTKSFRPDQDGARLRKAVDIFVENNINKGIFLGPRIATEQKILNAAIKFKADLIKKMQESLQEKGIAIPAGPNPVFTTFFQHYEGGSHEMRSDDNLATLLDTINTDDTMIKLFNPLVDSFGLDKQKTPYPHNELSSAYLASLSQEARDRKERPFDSAQARLARKKAESAMKPYKN